MTECKYRRAIQDLKSYNYDDKTGMQEINELLQKEMFVKITSCILQEKRQLHLKNFGREETDMKFKSCEEALEIRRNNLEQEKERLNNILQKVQEEHDLHQQKIAKLEEKLKIFETKKSHFEARWKLNPLGAQAGIEKCQQAVVMLESEIDKQKAGLKNLHIQIQDLRSKLDHKNADEDGQSGRKLIARIKKVVKFLETVSGLKVSVLSHDQVGVTFVTEPSESILPEAESLNLDLTLTFDTGCHGETRLADVKINVDHFNIKDIVDTAIALNDVPYLIQSTSERWNQHYPLLTEMDVLNKHHAIDWIPEKSQLRVLVGKCGNIMFSLGVPKDYPASRDITLLDNYGINDVAVDDLPAKGSTLLQWVLHLENQYGNL